jgi:hypothetical protein
VVVWHAFREGFGLLVPLEEPAFARHHELLAAVEAMPGEEPGAEGSLAGVRYALRVEAREEEVQDASS